MVPLLRDMRNSSFDGISFIHWEAPTAASKKKKMLLLLLVHRFDLPSLKYRRLGPQLAALGVGVYCVDLMGWGYSQLDLVSDFSARANVEVLKGF